ncbi:hypothetical protein [Tenacibaculum sp. 190524A05c]|uniref:Nucleic acid binding protein n=1 Tax=Tenacibaculum platacis TaxID=3137852 RepID=A0ABM9P2C2_9FLAO
MRWLKKNKVITIVTSLLTISFFIYQYTFRPNESIEDISPDYLGTSIDFIRLATTNFDSWNTKVVQLTGEITALDKNGFTLNNKLFCQFKHEDDSSNVKANQTITIKGRVIGYDDLLEELKLNECIQLK